MKENGRKGEDEGEETGWKERGRNMTGGKERVRKG